jgi:hypothetical protein
MRNFPHVPFKFDFPYNIQDRQLQSTMIATELDDLNSLSDIKQLPLSFEL